MMSPTDRHPDATNTPQRTTSLNQARRSLPPRQTHPAVEPARSNSHGMDALVQGREVGIAEGALSDEREEGRHLGDEQGRLFPGREVATAFGFVPVDDVAEALLGPAP
jgi:hypothetical protein